MVQLCIIKAFLFFCDKNHDLQIYNFFDMFSFLSHETATDFFKKLPK